MKNDRILHAVGVYMLPVWLLVYPWVTAFKGMLAVVTSSIPVVTMVYSVLDLCFTVFSVLVISVFDDVPKNKLIIKYN